ncbi:MAG: DNA repair protein RecN [Aquisalimonadaceae bacterium]
MLTHLHIRDFTLVDRLDLDIAPGMTALTGETGAGKSILLDALGLTLGDRADTDTVRRGSERAEVTVSFSIDALPEVDAWLREHDLDDDGECLLRRVVHANGRSKGFINGRPVPLQLLRELGEQLVDIHGQHEHQSLMKREIQRAVLDAFGNCQDAVGRVRDLHDRILDIDREMSALGGGHEDTDARRDLLSYQVKELEGLDLEQMAITALEDEHRRLANAGDLLENAQQLLQMLHEDDGSAQSILGQAQRSLEAFAGVDPVFGEVLDLIAGSLVQLEEGVDTLRRHADAMDLNPERLAEVEQQISHLTDLARKHRCRPEELSEVRDRLQDELTRLEHAGEHLEQLDRDRAETAEHYRSAAAALTARRNEAAENLARLVTEQLSDLGMAGAAFRIDLTPLERPDTTAHGLDQITFEVRTNAGQPFGPLSRIASGGELSRISLAIQVAAADSTHIPTLIFDEADSGIGGGVAEVVGRQLRTLGRSHQVLCVTHLPQVAAQAHHHLKVSKQMETDSTRSQVSPMGSEERVREIARMLGGVEITDTTLEHAGEMVSRAQTA